MSDDHNTKCKCKELVSTFQFFDSKATINLSQIYRVKNKFLEQMKNRARSANP